MEGKECVNVSGGDCFGIGVGSGEMGKMAAYRTGQGRGYSTGGGGWKMRRGMLVNGARWGRDKEGKQREREPGFFLTNNPIRILLLALRTPMTGFSRVLRVSLTQISSEIRQSFHLPINDPLHLPPRLLYYPNAIMCTHSEWI